MRRWIARSRALLLALALTSFFGCFSLVGDSSSFLSKEEERKIGEQVVAQVRRQFRVLDDPYLSAYLTGIGERLGAAMDAHEFSMDFRVVADPRINAFAVPGGHIFVTSQCILMCQDESELAGVVAHEMGHVEGRHIAHRMQKATRVNLATMAAVIAAGLIGGGSELGGAAATFAVAAAQTKMLQYSRTDEEDADRRSVRALLPAGYDGWGIVRFMETMRRESPAPEGVPAYLFTHPLPQNRAAYLATSLPPPPDEEPTAAELGPLWRAQARVLVPDPRDWGLPTFEKRAHDHPDSPDARLGVALLVRAQGRFEDALTALDDALRMAPSDVELRHEKAVTMLRQGRVAEGLALLESLRSEGVATVPVLRDLGWAYLEAEQGEQALIVYDELARRDPSSWDKLDYVRGMALGKAGRPGEAHASLGDYYRSQGNRDLATHHYQEALRSLPQGELRARVEANLAGLGNKRR